MDELHLENLVERVLRRVLDDYHPLTRREWLTVQDVARLTGFSAYKVKELRRKGHLPMFKAPDSNEWRMRPKDFDAWERRAVEAGTPMEVRYPPLGP